MRADFYRNYAVGFDWMALCETKRHLRLMKAAGFDWMTLRERKQHLRLMKAAGFDWMTLCETKRHLRLMNAVGFDWMTHSVESAPKQNQMIIQGSQGRKKHADMSFVTF